MKKANLKTATVVWIILTIVAAVCIIISSIWMVNATRVIEAGKFIDFDLQGREALKEKAYSIALLCFSVVIFLMGTYITYVGLKSWKYNAIL